MAALFALQLLLVTDLFGQSEKPLDEKARATEPIIVNVGVYLLDLYELDLKEESFMADFYIWMTWKDGSSTDHDGELVSATNDPRAKEFTKSRFDNFEFMNGELEEKTSEQGRMVNGTCWRSFRCRGKFRSALDFRSYPLDTQLLTIVIEDADNDIAQLRYTFEPAGRAKPDVISMSGWKPGGPIAYAVSDYAYETNYGNPSRDPNEKAVYSRMTISVPITHVAAGWTYLKLFIPVYISVLIALLAFLIDPTDLDPRFGVGIAAVFAAVTSMVVSNATAPETPYFSLIDRIHLISLAFIFATLLWSCVSLKMCRIWCKEKTCCLDKKIGVAILATYAATVGLITLWN